MHGKTFVRGLVFTSVLGCLSGVASAQTWTQVWSDEFNGSGAPSSANWTFDVGGGGWGNNELEYYQSGSANANQTGGVLNIQARQQSVGGMPYTSARIKTQGIRSFGPGDSAAVRLEARLSGPNGQGFWPAFWMLGTNIGSVGWPGCGEIDIMEHINSVPNVYGTIHWIDNNGGQASYTAASPGMTSFTSYHTYAITWDANLITWYLDGANVGAANIQGSINGTDEFHKPFFTILNLAVGGSWPGNPDGSTVFPANMNVDYVRYYTAGSAPPPPTPTPTSGGGGGTTSISGNHTVGFFANASKRMDVNGSSTANGTKVQVWDSNGTGAQSWNFTTSGVTPAGYYNIAALGPFCLDVNGGGSADGTKVQLWGCNGSGAQSWKLVPLSNGFYNFIAPTGKCLDVPGGNMTNGTQLQIWTCASGNTNQMFKIN